MTWTVTNFGATAWSGTRYWVDRVYFSQYPTLNTSATRVSVEFPHSNDQPLAAGASYTADRDLHPARRHRRDSGRSAATMSTSYDPITDQLLCGCHITAGHTEQ